jgi:hypothetical protein
MFTYRIDLIISHPSWTPADTTLALAVFKPAWVCSRIRSRSNMEIAPIM